MKFFIPLTIALAASTASAEIYAPTPYSPRHIVFFNFEISTEVDAEDNKYLYYNGYFHQDTDRLLQQAVDEYDPEYIVFNSRGGVISVIDSVRETIKNIPIIVDEKCMSACAVAVAPSNDLTINGVLGFHRPTRASASSSFISGIKPEPIEPAELVEMFDAGVSSTLDMTVWFLKAGLSLEFLETVMRDTDAKHFMTFNDADNFQKCKTNEDCVMNIELFE